MTYKNNKQATAKKTAIETLETRTLLAQNPLVITHGGTYSGTWESDDRSVPAVVVKTSEPVIIENSVVRGRGDLIVSDVDHKARVWVDPLHASQRAGPAMGWVGDVEFGLQRVVREAERGQEQDDDGADDGAQKPLHIPNSRRHLQNRRNTA